MYYTAIAKCIVCVCCSCGWELVQTAYKFVQLQVTEGTRARGYKKTIIGKWLFAISVDCAFSFWQQQQPTINNNNNNRRNDKNEIERCLSFRCNARASDIKRIVCRTSNSRRKLMWCNKMVCSVAHTFVLLMLRPYVIRFSFLFFHTLPVCARCIKMRTKWRGRRGRAMAMGDDGIDSNKQRI